MTRRTMVAILSLVLGVLLDHPASAAEYPAKPLEFIAPASAGGGWDLTARTLARVLQEEKLVPVQIRVTNMPGGSGTVALSSIANNRRADPYTLAVFSPSLALMIATKRTPLGVKDFTPVAALTTDYGVLVVRKDARHQDLKTFLADYKKDPNSVSIGGGSAPAGQDHIGAALMVKAAGGDAKRMKYIAHQSSGDAMLALLGGHIDAAFGQVSTAVEQLQAGRIRLLGVFSEKRLGGVVKDVPTGKEQGLDFVSSVWRGMYMPPGVAKEHVAHWDVTFRKLQTTRAWQEALEKYRWFSAYVGPNDFPAFVAREIAEYETLLRELGFVK